MRLASKQEEWHRAAARSQHTFEAPGIRSFPTSQFHLGWNSLFLNVDEEFASGEAYNPLNQGL